ncbi:MAG: Gfo/Idh/MocA family oxidoreductase [Verrucomicrobiae bacterium]|nr:Gfo/Idh/MocA family oxidoreductase [Verrucomicrobiae bacterium]
MTRRDFLRLGAAAMGAPAMAWAGGAKLRVAVIGHTGRGNYGHGLDTMWRLIPETEIVAVADADPKGLAAAKQRLEIGAGFADYREMLGSVRPDIVAVCTRHPDQHRDMVLASVGAGAKGIYIEKPFCRTPEEADQILAACEPAGTRLAVAHRNRYHPALPRVKELIEGGAIGRLLEFRGRGKEDERGGAEDLWVLGSHVINLAHYLAGEPTGCSAWIEQQGHPVARADVREGNEGLGPLAGDALHARYDMQCGLPFYFDSFRRAGTREAGFGLQVIGNAGIIDLRVDCHPLAHVIKGNPFLPHKDPRAWVPVSSAGAGEPEPAQDMPGAVEKHLVAGRDLVAAIREGRPPLCDARQGAITIEMICAAFESHRLGGRRVGFPLETRTNPLQMLENS